MPSRTECHNALMRPLNWMLVILCTSLVLAASLIVLATGLASGVPLKQQPMVIVPMILSVLLPLGFIAVKRFTDARAQYTQGHEQGRRQWAAALDAVARDLAPMHPASASDAMLGRLLPTTMTFEFNRDKFLYFGGIGISLSCVGSCVTGLFVPSVRTQTSGDEETAIDMWVWVLLTNLAIVVAVLVIAVAIIGISEPGYFLRLDSEHLVLGRWRRIVEIPWATVQHLRIEHQWLIATVDPKAGLADRAHAINGIEPGPARFAPVRRALKPDDVALARMAGMSASKGSGKRFFLAIGWFWGLSKTDDATADRLDDPASEGDASAKGA